MSKTAIIFASGRSHGNTRQIVDYVLDHYDATLYDLNLYAIGYYDYEYKNKTDDFHPLMKKLVHYDKWIFATPVYWYSMSAPLKTFFDRITDLLKTRRDLKPYLKGKQVYTISCGSDKELIDGFYLPFIESAAYLKMKHIAAVHTWIEDEDAGIPSVVKERLKQFMGELKKY